MVYYNIPLSTIMGVFGKVRLFVDNEDTAPSNKFGRIVDSNCKQVQVQGSIEVLEWGSFMAGSDCASSVTLNDIIVYWVILG